MHWTDEQIPRRSPWRETARVVISRVMREYQGQDPKVVLREIDRAYPFGERRRFPYKMWLRERQLAKQELGLAPRQWRTTRKREVPKEQLSLFEEEP